MECTHTTCKRAHTYIHTHTHIHPHACTHIHPHTHTHASTCMHTHTSTHTHTYIYTHTCIHMHAHTRHTHLGHLVQTIHTYYVLSFFLQQDAQTFVLKLCDSLGSLATEVGVPHIVDHSHQLPVLCAVPQSSGQRFLRHMGLCRRGSRKSLQSHAVCEWVANDGLWLRE